MKGVIAITIACIVWGLSGILFNELSNVQPSEIVAHRGIWGALVLLIYCLKTNRIKPTIDIVKTPINLIWLFASAFLIALNWIGFVWATQKGHAISASLGYYILPLINIVFGALFLGEKINKIKLISISLAFIGVIILSFGLGVPPWVALFLSTSFSFYSLIRRLVSVRPVIGTFVEFLIIVPFAVIWLIGAHFFNWQGFTDTPPGAFGSDLKTTLLLISTGFLVIPLILYTYATRAIGMTNTGLFFYLNPTLQLVVAATFFAEKITKYHIIALFFIWLGLVVISVYSIRQSNKSKSKST